MKNNICRIRNRIILLAIIIIFFLYIQNNNIFLSQEIIIHRGDTFSKFTQELSYMEKLRLKLHTRLNDMDLSRIETGVYNFTGSYFAKDFIRVVNQGPSKEYLSLTIFEGRSSYDVDDSLTQKGLIQEGEYINYINNKDQIKKLYNTYSFLRTDIVGNKKISSLEGFLYPDTYYIDIDMNVLYQITKLQLDNFQEKIWRPYQSEIQGFDVLSFYEILILSSIVEKEERNKNNQPMVAGILLNRIQAGTLIGADISLCYGLQLTHNKCKPSLIVQEISNKKNMYNTRQNKGLPPSPIANPTAGAVKAVLTNEKTTYFYYLHDIDGNIHYAETLEGHNQNKREYL